MQQEPPPYVWAMPEEKNILTCACFRMLDSSSEKLIFPVSSGNFLIVRHHSPHNGLPVSLYLRSCLQRGPPDSPFSGGEYHGVLLFPPEYPFKPPGIKVCTPVTVRLRRHSEVPPFRCSRHQVVFTPTKRSVSQCRTSTLQL